MASILEFRRHGLNVRSQQGRGTAGASADIVLFPGVRYERFAEEPTAKPRGRRSRRRDRLELDD